MTINPTKPISADEKLESLHAMVLQRAADLTAALQGGNCGRDEIGHRMVYLKFYAGSCFQCENEVMLSYRFAGHATHRAEHKAIAEELSLLLEKFLEKDVSIQSIDSASGRFLGLLRTHVARHDGELFSCMSGKERRATAAPGRKFAGLGSRLFQGGDFCPA